MVVMLIVTPLDCVDIDKVEMLVVISLMMLTTMACPQVDSIGYRPIKL